jgi:hypothetical protein
MSDSNAHNEPDPKLWRPFLRLGVYLRPQFLKRAEQWLYLVGAYGIDRTPVQPTTTEEWSKFFAHCHDGWKQAQIDIAAFLIDAIPRRSQAEAAERDCHRLRDKQGMRQARAATHEVELEIKVARRMLDVIIWTIFMGEHSTLRRLQVQDGKHSFSVASIEEAMRVASSLNDDPLVMAVSTDMLSLVHVGDLVVSNLRTGQVDFVELKAGKKNAAISAAAQFAVQSGCERFEATATAQLNGRDRKHYERVKRQVVRNETIISTIRNEGGVDPNTGNEVVIQPTIEPVEFWSDRIQRCYERLAEDQKTWAIDVIDDCIYLGVYSDQAVAFAGFNSWMQTHECESRIFNLADSFCDPGVRPLGAAMLSLELRQKVLRGEILVIMCLDIQKFIDLGNSMQPGFLRLASRSESAEARRRGIGSFALNGRYIHSTVEGEGAILGEGARDRLLFDQHCPTHFLAERLAAGRISKRLKVPAK